MSVEEWGPYGTASERYWDSMLVYSANIEDVLDDGQSHVPAEIHMQNLVSWDPYFKLGDSPGRTMVRAYGQHISGYDDLPATVRGNFEKYTPEIFDLDSWQETRLDAVDFMLELIEKRANGTLDIDQPDYQPHRVKRFDELEGF